MLFSFKQIPFEFVDFQYVPWFSHDLPMIFAPRLNRLKDAMQQATQARLQRGTTQYKAVELVTKNSCWIIIWYYKAQSLVIVEYYEYCRIS